MAFRMKKPPGRKPERKLLNKISVTIADGTSLSSVIEKMRKAGIEDLDLVHLNCDADVEHGYYGETYAIGRIIAYGYVLEPEDEWQARLAEWEKKNSEYAEWKRDHRKQIAEYNRTKKDRELKEKLRQNEEALRSLLADKAKAEARLKEIREALQKGGK